MFRAQYIFYADDDPDDTAFFTEAIVTLGHRVKVFPNGQLLVKTLCEEDTKPDIIFIDVHMPNSSGPKILDVIRACSEFIDIPVILFTGFSRNSNDVKKYLDSGANYLLEKPMDFADYANSLRTMLNIDWKTYHAKPDDFLSA